MKSKGLTFKEISASKQTSKEIEQPLSVDSGNGSETKSLGLSSPIEVEDLIEMDVQGVKIAEGSDEDESDKPACKTIIAHSDSVSSTKLKPKGKRKSSEMCSDCPTITLVSKRCKSEDT